MTRKFKFRDIPPEMLLVLQERCGSKWDPAALAEFMEEYDSGFPVDQMCFYNTKEGFDFWSKIFNGGDLNHFYTKYPPKNKMQRFTEKPKGARKGDKFVVVAARDSVKVGDILTLAFNDRTDMPRFSHPNGKEYWYEWVHLAPISSVNELGAVSEDSYSKGFSEIPTGYEPGDKFIIVNTKRHNGEDLNYYYEPRGLKVGDIIELVKKGDNPQYPYFKDSTGKEVQADWFSLAFFEKKKHIPKVSEAFPDSSRPNEKVGTKYILVNQRSNEDGLRAGDIVTLQENDGTHNPFFRTKTGSRNCISWNKLAPYTEVKIVGNISDKSQTLTNSTNLNLQQNGYKVQQSSNSIVLSSVPPTITYGSVIRGTELRSHREACKLGS